MIDPLPALGQKLVPAQGQKMPHNPLTMGYGAFFVEGDITVSKWQNLARGIHGYEITFSGKFASLRATMKRYFKRLQLLYNAPRCVESDKAW